MNRLQALEFHKQGMLCIPKFHPVNSVPSFTDPTQDIPIKRLQMAANGLPINVRQLNAVYSNSGVEKLTSIDRRNHDAFDALGELQSIEKKVNSLKPIEK